MKKILAISGVIGAFLIGFFIYYFNDNPDKQEPAAQLVNGMEDHLFGKSLVLDAKIDEFQNLNAVEEKTEIIVVGKKVKQEEPTIVYNKEGRIDIAYTLSNFAIDKVISGDSVTPGTEITILENEAYNKKVDMTYHIAGYELMEKDKEYLLFLRKSQTDPYYLITGVNYGKVPLKDENSSLKKSLNNANTDYAKEKLSEIDHQNLIKAEALKKYESSLK
ncbi:hypothetical protein P4U03_14305 [Bacillus mycoides]|jgi:hypothetical protein|uniref:Uncharacterized protein n=1 Tax=Bacillus thuringiensis serovar navarrensis TaxID=339658 RepID=A0A243A9F1_BACTU|nr:MULTISPECIES: hypothetical protein [Bacillus cereus group]MED1267764.1 hypothetical protein [Bacillus mycoides]OTY15192.1 hypothetical protein BK732_18845 [Bacillus thuringiensis serovar navarrensis]